MVWRLVKGARASHRWARCSATSTAMKLIAHPAEAPPRPEMVQYKTPLNLAIRPRGKELYVTCESSRSVCVIDATTLQEEKRLSASRSPWALALSPDGTRLLVSNALPRFVKFREPPLSEVTVIDTLRSVVEDRAMVPEANMLQGVAWHPSGQFALATLQRTKNLVPMTRLLQGWTVTNGLGIVRADGPRGPGLAG